MTSTFATVIVTAAITALLTQIASLIATRYIERAKWTFRRDHENELLISNIKDLSRHLQRGINRIEEFSNEMDIGNKKVAEIHLRKLRVDEDNVVFSDDVLRYLDPALQLKVIKARVQIRNFNLDCDFASEIYRRCARSQLIQTIYFVNDRGAYLKQALENAFDVAPQQASKETGGILYFSTEGANWEDIPFKP